MQVLRFSCHPLMTTTTSSHLLPAFDGLQRVGWVPVRIDKDMMTAMEALDE